MALHTLIQQKEIQEVIRMTGIGPQNKSNRRGFKGIKCKDLCNDIERRSFQPVARQTTKS